MKKKLFFSVLVLLLLFIACRKEHHETTIETPTDNGLVLSPVTKIIKEANGGLVSADSTKLIFNGLNQQIADAKKGDILVSDVTSVAPDGYLRKITETKRVGNQTIITTENASLAEAIKDGSVSFTRKITAADILEMDSTDVSLTKNVNSNGTLGISFKKTLFDDNHKDGKPYSQINIEGGISFKGDFVFDLKIENYQVINFLTKVIFENSDSISLITRGIFIDKKVEKVICRFKLAPFTIYIGGLPVPIARQWIYLIAGFDGSAKVKIETKVVNTFTTELGLAYSSSHWSAVSNSTDHAELKLFNIAGEASIEPWLQLRYEICPYGLTESKVYLAARVSARAEAKVNLQELAAKADIGFKFFGKAQAKILSHTLMDYEQVFLEKYNPLFQKVFTYDKNRELLAYYPFDGNAAEETGNGLDGVVYGAQLCPDRKGNPNSAFEFDGIDDYIQINHNERLNIPGSISVSAWINSKDVTLSQRIVDKTTVDYADGFMIDLRPTGQIRFLVGDSYVYQPHSDPVITLNDKWYHIVTVYDQTMVYIYINGQLNKAISKMGNSYLNNLPLRIGANSRLAGDFFKGKIDDIRIYNRAISADEVVGLYNE